MAVPASGILRKLPDRILPDCCKRSGLCYILYPGDKDTGCPAIVTRYLCFVENGLDYLVRFLFAMITVRAVFCEDEPVAHLRYWMRPGSLICPVENLAPNKLYEPVKVRENALT
jgi:hypothetical protein